MDNNLLAVLENLLTQMYFHCDWAIYWDNSRNYIELIFQIPLCTPDNNLTDLELDQKPADAIYEFYVLFYDERVIEELTMTNVKAFPIDYHKGTPYGELYSIISYLRQLTAKARLQWYEFNQNRRDKFNIEWNQSDFERVRDNVIKTHRYAPSRVFFPR